MLSLSKRPAEQMIIRGGAISMIFQEPMASFAPAITIGEQMVEQLMIHSAMTRNEARNVSIEMLTRVGIPEPAQRFGQYAFEFSGGMRQRAMIAMALSTKPAPADRRRTDHSTRRYHPGPGHRPDEGPGQ